MQRTVLRALTRIVLATIVLAAVVNAQSFQGGVRGTLKDAQGIIPTSEQVEAEVAARKQAIVDTAVAAYEAGSLADDLAAAIAPLLRFELSPDQFGRLQTAGLLKIAKYDLVEIGAEERYYYRDHYVRDEEPTKAARLADNLHSKPRYKNTPSGRVFLQAA